MNTINGTANKVLLGFVFLMTIIDLRLLAQVLGAH